MFLSVYLVAFLSSSFANCGYEDSIKPIAWCFNGHGRLATGSGFKLPLGVARFNPCQPTNSNGDYEDKPGTKMGKFRGVGIPTERFVDSVIPIMLLSTGGSIVLSIV